MIALNFKVVLEEVLKEGTVGGFEKQTLMEQTNEHNSSRQFFIVQVSAQKPQMQVMVITHFGQMSSDLLAYGASDGTFTVCTVSDPPAVLNQLIGHSKDVTALLLLLTFI
ncbi:hypothetical protein CsSME_00017523 [Camellia sinensis var. sinensis]